MRIAIVGPTEVLVVSYWENEEALRASFRDKAHVEMMRYTYQHPEDLVLGNETYSRPISTRYMNEPGGFALAKHVPSSRSSAVQGETRALPTHQAHQGRRVPSQAS